MDNKELIYLKGFAKGKNYNNLLKSIFAAVNLHEKQLRKSGEPYISHPIRVCSELVALGIHDEDILCTAILHDVIEDCDITVNTLMADYHISAKITSNVNKLSKIGVTSDHYYEIIKENPEILLVKIADRCHNLSTMTGAFSENKINEYIEETEKYILPLCKYGKDIYPEYSDKIFIMKYHIESLINSIKFILNNKENNKL